uniref:Sodium-coupled monocarboxylate transporter 1 n=1 Tax=Glossina palpalis gambiensis TaxID=67801 RepID=A0A1B0BRG4_9MUSC
MTSTVREKALINSTTPSILSIASILPDNRDNNDSLIFAMTSEAAISTRSATMTATATATTTTTATTTIKTTAAAAAAVSIEKFEKVKVADLSTSLQHFGWMDYFIFVLMLVVCAIVGIYFGFIEKKQKGSKRSLEHRRGSEALDYLVGGRKMKVVPVSLSLVASFVSGISLLGTSTEIYVYGTQYAFILITLAISGVVSWYVFLPVFYNLQLTSTYEYFEMRFGKAIRLFGSTLFSVGTITWLPIVIYVPALAFNQVTGINIHIVTPVVCVVCIFYTTVGGLKAVVWTDVIQTVIMIGAIIFIIVKGTIDIGGFHVVWQRNYDSGRIELPDFTWDPTVRISMLSIFVGTTLYFIQVCCGNQVIVQRYLSLPSMKQAKLACVLFTGGVILFYLITFYNGLLIFATYHDCDPLSTKLAKAKDQLVPLMVMETLRFLPGMPGLFVAGVFSAALSSLSTGLNSLAAVFLEDYIKPSRVTPLSERQTAIIMRISVVLIGTLCVALVFVVEHLGHAVLQLSITLGSVTCGPLLGLFLMGLLVPWINAKSAMSGSIISTAVMTWICVKGQMALASGELVAKTVSEYIYHMSFTFYVTVGCLVSIISSGLSTIIFGRNNPSEMDKKLFAPCIRSFIKPSPYQSVCKDEQTVIHLKNDLKLSSKDFMP